jgi:hypothetical protein
MYNIQWFEFCSPKHVVVRWELDQFLNLAGGNGVLYQISIKTTWP